MANEKLSSIHNAIINDPNNREFIKKGYKPIYQVSEHAKILIIGQAPGLKTQEKGISFQDQSGDILRSWLNVGLEEFYNEKIFAVLPLDFFYPGKGKSGDLPPRKGFAEKWHPLIIKELKDLKLVILVGTYAIKYYLNKEMEKNLTETVRNYQKFLPKYFPLVHPSPLNFRWHIKNPWFKEDVIKDLQKIVKEIIK